MPGIVTTKFRIHNAKQFYEAFSEPADINTRMYMFIARTRPWTTESSPPTPTDSFGATEYDVWRDMIAAKRITASDRTHAVRRINWSNNTFYTPYTSTNGNLTSNNFFVVTDTYNVYKCIDNNNGANSTVKPTTTTTSTVELSDGYKWKFMYNISAADALKFLTTNYIPVKTLTSDDSSAQWDVQQAASNGTIEAVLLTAGGSAYLESNGTIQLVNSTAITLESKASGTDNIYNGSTLYIRSGLGSGQLKEIVDYTGATRIAIVNSAYTITPNTSSQYHVGPKVSITGDGSGALAYANVSSGTITDINLISGGSNYSSATTTITANSGTSATAVSPVPPNGGHGADPIDELLAFNIMLNTKFTGTESNTFVVNNDFRVIGILKDPKLANGAQANSSVYDLTTKLTLTDISGTFQNDEVLDGGTSGASARILAFANTNASGNSGVLSVSAVTGAFSASETVTGNTSTVTATVSSIDARDLQSYSGEVLYVENRPPISRGASQIEDVKLIVRF
jgi:hypothetical protein